MADGGGTMLDVARRLTAGGAWAELHPPTQTPAAFADAARTFLARGQTAFTDLEYGRTTADLAQLAGPPTGRRRERSWRGSWPRTAWGPPPGR